MKRRYTVLWLLTALAALWLSGRQHAPLLAARRALWPETVRQELENASPLVAFTTVALAGFQGLIADMLWLRIYRLQDEGQYFEIVQLADWITKLEPRFTDVWVFHAWNMAYNISVMFPDPPDRWRWVQHGIRLLRDEGLRHNPADPKLYQELGWLFQHKIGQHWDDAHQYYKWQLAQEISALLGGGSRLDPDWLRDNPQKQQQLLETYGMDPDTMLAVDRAYGPLDWRAAESHAIYWAWRGLQVAPAAGSLANDRMIFQSLAQAFRQGEISLDAERQVLLSSPRLDLLPSVRRAFEAALERYHRHETIQVAYRNFLNDAMMLFFIYGQPAEARKIYADLPALFPEEHFDGDMETIVTEGFLAEMQQISLRHATAMIEGFFYQGAIYRALAESEQADAMDRLARMLWQRAAERFSGRAATELPSADRLQRQALERAHASHGILFHRRSPLP